MDFCAAVGYKWIVCFALKNNKEGDNDALSFNALGIFSWLQIEKKSAYAAADFIIHKKPFAQKNMYNMLSIIGPAPQLTSKQISLISNWKQ